MSSFSNETNTMSPTLYAGFIPGYVHTVAIGKSLNFVALDTPSILCNTGILILTS